MSGQLLKWLSCHALVWSHMVSSKTFTSVPHVLQFAKILTLHSHNILYLLGQKGRRPQRYVVVHPEGLVHYFTLPRIIHMESMEWRVDSIEWLMDSIEKTGARRKGEAYDVWTEQVREPHLNNTHTHFKTLTHFHPLYVCDASSLGFSRY